MRTLLQFQSSDEFSTWLETHHEQDEGVWLVLAKKGKGNTLSYAQALECALCYGWIDGQKAKNDEVTWLQYFCKRKPKSVWSRVNQDHVARLTSEGRMRDPGLAAVARAKVAGTWDRAYQPPSSREIPTELAAALATNPEAMRVFEGLSSQNRFAFVFRVQTAKKAETRERRAKEFVAMLERGELFHP